MFFAMFLVALLRKRFSRSSAMENRLPHPIGGAFGRKVNPSTLEHHDGSIVLKAPFRCRDYEGRQLCVKRTGDA